MLEALGNFAIAWSDPWLLFLTAAGTLAGIYIGAIPGLSVTMATSILISFTFKWHVNEALALIAGVFMGGVYGGSRTAILLNIPGAPSAIATRSMAPRPSDTWNSLVVLIEIKPRSYNNLSTGSSLKALT